MMHPLGLLGGTFDCFHAGHLALVERGLVECEVLEIWLTSDALAQFKDARTCSWNERTSDLLDSIGKAAAQRVSLHTLEDEDGPAPIHEVATAILCTPETRAGCARINSMRAANDLPDLAVIEVEHVLAGDGEPISSSRIRAGEIDREGLAWIPESARTGRIVLTPAVEAELKDPFGQLVPGPEDDPSVAMSQVLAQIEFEAGPLIAVGDVTVLALQELDHPADIALIDGRTKRQPWESADAIDASVYDKVLRCQSPAGSLTPSLLEACAQALTAWMDDGSSHLIEVDGEEDLAPLFLHPLAPMGAVVLYGQPGKGVVVRRTNEDAKQRCRRLLSGFASTE
uniref:Cytidyltransferase-like domain-containing protein n=1 Tax=uncultured marine microorganism HF4000_ANIW137G21 TaxID=455530 RepID=B3T4J4_9ZZZZ|nr:putative protein of unknown function (DUF359) [uncultured marine microorganism HF4000_ANIW137G21]